MAVRTSSAARGRCGRGVARAAAPDSKAVLCLLPPGWRVDPVRALLAAYEVAFAEDAAHALHLARRDAYDLYLLASPLLQAQVPMLCRRIRGFDAQTPLIVYSLQPTSSERSAALDAGAQAYVSPWEATFNLAATAAQLVMLAELRSIDALRKGAKALHEHLSAGLASVGSQVNGAGAALRTKLQRQLKAQASRIFAQQGGNRAHFERLWPSLFQSALERTGAFIPPASRRLARGLRLRPGAA